MTRITTLLSLSLVLALATGCPPERRDDDDTGGDDFGGLDTNGDGALDADDVDSGEAAAYFTLDFMDEEGEEDVSDEALTTTNIVLSPGGSGGWYLNATFGDEVSSYTISLRFENFGSPDVGVGDVTNANLTPGDQSWFAFGNDPGGEVEITEVGDGTASGFFSGVATLEVMGQFEEPTGETVLIRGFAFRDAPIDDNIDG